MGRYIAAGVDGSPQALAAAHRAEQLLQETVGHVRAARPAPTGAPVTALLAAAADADTLILGWLGLGRTAGRVTGSVTLPGVGRAPCPLVLGRAGRTAADERLAAVDGVAPEAIPRIPYRALDSARRRTGGVAPAVPATEAFDGAVLRPWYARYPEVSVSRTGPRLRPVAPPVIHPARCPHA
ncbi:hypothetical protein ACWCV9_01250 [Streptomyces sp. NPDC001606]